MTVLATEVVTAVVDLLRALVELVLARATTGTVVGSLALLYCHAPSVAIRAIAEKVRTTLRVSFFMIVIVFRLQCLKLVIVCIGKMNG